MSRRFRSCCALSALVVLGWSAAGCESLERKFTRKPKNAGQRPTPVVVFEDYTRAMTPLDRYRKHYVLFDYWNGDLISGLQESQLNGKRLKRASSEALGELRTLQQLLVDAKSAELAPLIEERTRLDGDVQRADLTATGASAIWRDLERQSRQISRGFFWRDIEGQLKEQAAPPAVSE